MDEDLTKDQILSLQNQINMELCKRHIRDLNELMQTATFRRFISYQFVSCGMRTSFPMGNSKDIFNAGRRAVGIELEHDIDSIEEPHRTSGMELRQLAEREYVDLELALHDHLKELMKHAVKKGKITKNDKY